MREVPKKNYFIMLVIIITIVIVTIVLASVYNKNNMKTSIMYNYLSEIKINDFDVYIVENPNTIIYIGDKYSVDNDAIEKKIKNKIIELNVSDYFVYLNLTDNIEYIDKLNERYDVNISKDLPVIVVFEDGKIKNVYSDLKNLDLKAIIGDIK